MSLILEQSFGKYKRADSDYWIIAPNGEQLPTNTTFYEPNDVIEEIDKVSIISDRKLKELSPDNIDSGEFWKAATDEFPLFSVAGGPNTLKTREDVNHATLIMAAKCGAITAVLNQIQNEKNLVMLEIGPGHGGFMKAMVKEGIGDNYYAIDVNPLFEHPRLFKTDGRTIPESIPRHLNMVYSFNVFQHLSKAQRLSYYKQTFDRLKIGGVFIFGMFVVTKENEHWPCWGLKDKRGKCYTVFFGQFTVVDHIDEVYNELDKIGFSSVQQINPLADKTHYLTFRATK